MKRYLYISIVCFIIAVIAALFIGCSAIPKKHQDSINNTLTATFVAGQILNAGNMNWQQENGYYEINDTVYGKHPSKDTVYTIKAVETILIFGAVYLFPKYETEILFLANVAVWGIIYYDNKQGIELRLKF